MSEHTCGGNGGLTKAGTSCRSSLNLSKMNGLCILHDPERLAERTAMRSAAGKATKESIQRAKAARPERVPKAPKTLNDAVRIAAWITEAVLTGEIDVRVAEAATKAVRQFQLSEEKREMQKTIDALQKQLKSLGRKS